ncbi:MAG: hypothetical protein QOI73_2512 [Solirubrobacteraceae bacterium]|nr:hypothetical protein [Solirubrobacteraceae bacterium]
MGTAWHKQGLLLTAPLGPPWSASHVALPAIARGGAGSVGDRVDMYVSTRDPRGRSWIARAELDLTDERPRVVALDPEPVLAPGALGAFDDAGVTMSCVVRDGDETRLYYTGWSLGSTVPFYLAIGLAISRAGGPFERVSQAPILGRTANDPFMTASPEVHRDGGGWRMWYASCVRWERTGGDLRHHYHLRHGTSDDGLAWNTTGTACIDFADASEYAISRPSVLRTEDGYEMWFASRGDAYRLGYARSRDGVRWERHDTPAGLGPSETGWDSEMVAYPQVFEHDGRRLMLYNGNGYGASGVGSAMAA